MQDLVQNKERVISSASLYKAPVKYFRFPDKSPKSVKCFSDITNTRHLPRTHKKKSKEFISSYVFTKSLTPKPGLPPSSVRSQRNAEITPLPKFNCLRNQSVTPQPPNLCFPVPPKVVITYKSSRIFFDNKLKTPQKVFSCII